MRTRQLFWAIVPMSLAALAVACATASAREMAARFSVQYSGTWTEISTETDTGSDGKILPLGCGSSKDAGSLTSKVGPGHTTLSIEGDPGGGAVVHYLWGGESNQFGTVSFTENVQGTIDNTVCGGTVDPLNETTNCGSATRKGAVSFDTPNDGGSDDVVPSNERSFTLRFSWDLTPGLTDGCNSGPGNFLTSDGLNLFDVTAQRIDYLKLRRCAIARPKTCKLTLHGSKTFKEHTQSTDENEGGVDTIDGAAHLDWKIVISIA